MLNAYQTMIMEVTGTMHPQELAEIEELMREDCATLNGLSKHEFEALAKDAKEANDLIKEMGA